MPKRYLTGGGKDLKNQRKSEGYLYKTLNYVKSYTKEFERKLKNLNKKLIFTAYDKIGGVGSRAARISSSELSSRFMSVAFLRKGIASRATKIASYESTGGADFRSARGKILSSIRKLRLRSANSGAILIEFAICMPVLIILLFYINDLVRIKRYYSQTEFVGQQMANILQNIAKTRAITITDLKYAASLAFLSIYPGTTMFADGKRGNRSHELSHRPEFRVFYVKGLPEGKASVIWGWNGYCNTSTSPGTWQGGRIKSDSSTGNRGIVKWGENTDASNICPTLKMDNEKDKVILECFIYNDASTMSLTDYAASDNQDTRAKKAFKLRLVNPKAVYKNTSTGHYFISVVIFTPYSGFTENMPQ